MATRIDLDVPGWYQRWRLHRAAQDGDLAEIRHWIDAKYPLNRFDDLGKTPLHYAVQNGHLEAARLLLEAGADINAHDESVIGDTPIGAEARECTLDMARLLIEAGADPTIRGWMQLSALDIAEDRTDPQGHAIFKLFKKAAERKI